MRKQYYRKKKTVFSCAENHAGQKCRTKQTDNRVEQDIRNLKLQMKNRMGILKTDLAVQCIP